MKTGILSFDLTPPALIYIAFGLYHNFVNEVSLSLNSILNYNFNKPYFFKYEFIIT